MAWALASPVNLAECPQCRVYATDRKALVAACDGLSTEHGKATRRQLLKFMPEYHRSGHRHPGPPPNENWSGCEVP